MDGKVLAVLIINRFAVRPNQVELVVNQQFCNVQSQTLGFIFELE